MVRAEKIVAASLEKEGWNVLQNGWPDFLCYRDKDGKRELICVEVKDGGDKLSAKQIKNHALLLAAGFPVYVLKPSLAPPKLDSARSLEILVAETHADLVKRAARLEKILKQAEAAYSRERERTAKTFDARYDTYKQQAETILNSFRELASIFQEAPAKRKAA